MRRFLSPIIVRPRGAHSGRSLREQTSPLKIFWLCFDTLREMVSGKDNKVVYLPFEATGVLSSIGGIKEMLEGVGKAKEARE